ncbi:MAG: hypothetical protein GX054_04090 [Clostridiales bacterium]|nr:hypothetical protein [Clostridiales bacterium]
MKSSKPIIKKISVDKKHIHFYGRFKDKSMGEDQNILWRVKENNSFVDIFHTKINNAEGNFLITINRYDRDRDRIYSPFKLEMRLGQDEFIPIDGPCYVTELLDIALYNYDYPTSHTIKGLQVNMVYDAIKLGIGHAALNLNLPNIMISRDLGDSIPYSMDGEIFYFDRQEVEDFDRRVKELSDNGIVVNLILLNSRKWAGRTIDPHLEEELIHPDYDPEGFISAFNVVTERGLKRYKAFVEFVAERYTRPDQLYGRACGYIIGNEVNSQGVWSNAGDKTVKEYMEEYCIALRTAYFAARKKYSQARVYISLDHFWTLTHQKNPQRFYKGKDVIDILNNICHRDGNFDWGVAYHPYPENLFHADFWNDKTAIASFETGRITFKNIEILPQYLSQQEYRYKGRIRHIILSEQGFHSDENEESEMLQAAAYCLAYRKIAKIPGIESFILHAHVDNRDEFGLNLGLWRRDKSSDKPSQPGSPKPIYYVFKDIDGPKGEEVCLFAKEIVGEEYWI